MKKIMRLMIVAVVISAVAVFLFNDDAICAPSGKSGMKFPVSFIGSLSAEPNIDYGRIVEKTRNVLAELGIGEELFTITLLREANQVMINAKDVRTKDAVWKTIRDIEENYYKVVTTEVIALQYASAESIASLLTSMYSRKVYIQNGDEKISVKREDNNIDISTDTRSNSIIVTAPQNVIGVIRETVRKLDCKTDQIHIKVLIAEVSLDNTMQYGVEWKFAEKTFMGKDGVNPTAAVDYGYQKQAKQNELFGFKYSIISGDKLNAFIQMLRTQSHIEVLASPELLTSNNMKAQFQETIKVPVLKTTTTSNGVINTSTEYQNVGIELLVKPQVNIDEYINLEISQTIQNILDTLSNKQNAPTYSNRVINTNVLVKNGSTVVIGGLFKNNDAMMDSGLPGAGKSTLFGKLFGRTLKNNVKTELMVFMTPQISKTDGDFDAVVEDLKAPAIQTRLKEEKAERMAGFVKKDKKKITVISAAEDRVVISAGASDKIKKGEEFRIVRPEKEYYHPETHQLVSVEEKEVARIKVETLKDKTAVAAILSIGSNENVLAGDLVLPEDSTLLFENFRITCMKCDFTPNGDYSATDVKLNFKAKNTTKNSIIRTKMVDKLFTTSDPKNPNKPINMDHDKYKMSIIENGSAKPLKFSERLCEAGAETVILFNRIIRPDEEIEIGFETRIKGTIFFGDSIENLIAGNIQYAKMINNFGNKNSRNSFGVSLNYPDRIMIKDFSLVPAIIDNAMGGTTLVWAQEGSINIRGQWGFEDTAAVKKRIAKYVLDNPVKPAKNGEVK